MAVQTFDQVEWNNDQTEFTGVITSATAADTVSLVAYLNGKSIVGIVGMNVADETVLAVAVSSGIATIPSGPSADKVSITVKLLNC